MPLRAKAERIDDSEYPYRVYIWEYDPTTEISTLIEISEAPSIVTCLTVLNLENEPMQVEDVEGNWVEPDAITVAEALEAAL